MASKEALVVGALLHDIGKFEFRTEDRRETHGNYGDFFVEEYLGSFSCLQPILEEVRRLVAHHHEGDLADPFLKEADYLAAAERVFDDSPQTRRSLVSVLAAVDIGNPGKKPEGVYRYVPGPLDYRDPFPKHLDGVQIADWIPDTQQMMEEHRQAWEKFCEDMRLIPDADLQAWIETFLHVARKHLSRVTSAAYKSHPDISLYDHARSVAAIAVCLYQAHQEEKPFVLIQGDISGIQQFLYRLASPEEEGGTRQMAKRLRGRSFYLSLLAESVALRYLRVLELPPTNLLYSGGGHFSILAPNTAAMRERWLAVEKEINRWLFDRFGGDLALVCAATPADRSLLGDFSRLMQRSGEQLEQAKRQKFRSALDEKLFEPRQYAEKMDVCPVCQADFVKGSGQTCPACKDHVQTGQQILQAEYLVRLEGEALKIDSLGDFTALGIYWRLERDRDALANALRSLGDQPVRQIHVERLNGADFLLDKAHSLGLAQRAPVSFGFRPLGQWAPADEQGGPLEFEKLAAQNAANYPLLGVARLDMDSLAAVFALGLGKQHSLSRVATLSRELEGFFSGYVNQLAEKYQIYITYAGGDDLFVVGSWINALDFCRDLRRAFGRFACDNPNLTLSGGIFFCKPDFPIGRAAEMAGELEKEAKKAEGKNSLSLFGEVVSWERLEELMDFGEKLLSLVEEKGEDGLPRSFVHRLLALGLRLKESLKERQKGKDLKKEMEVRMRLKYLIARRGATSQALSAKEEMPEKKRKIGILGRLATEPKLLEQIAIPASYVLYRTRNLKEEDGEKRHG